MPLNEPADFSGKWIHKYRITASYAEDNSPIPPPLDVKAYQPARPGHLPRRKLREANLLLFRMALLMDL
jgi:hypothetical protein